MEEAISAIAGDVISRFMLFLINKYTDKTGIDKKLERLQQLLLRIHVVVEEADGRYITNPRMLMQLQLLVNSMYRGYHMQDTFRYKVLNDEVRSLSTMPPDSSIPLKRSRSIAGTTRNIDMSSKLQSVVENLEVVVADMNEFVILLAGCERMCRRPYDSYIYIENFMFGRHVEKQKIINILLHTPCFLGAPVVLPIIGGIRVGKKTMVSHVCNDERIRCHFSSILYIGGDKISRMDHVEFSNERTLLVVEFIKDVDDDVWEKFYSIISENAASGSKVMIISRIEKISRLGTVKVDVLNRLSQEEYSYLFKMLAFGSADEKDYPQMASIANEIALVLGGSLVTINTICDLLRRNFDVKFWFRILRTFKVWVQSHIKQYSEHPKDMFDQRSIDITALISSCPFRYRLMPPQVERADAPNRNPTNIMFADLIEGCTTAPKNDFQLTVWVSRMRPYAKYVCLAVPVEERHGCSTSTRKRGSII